jgi:hypothetical protein
MFMAEMPHKHLTAQSMPATLDIHVMNHGIPVMTGLEYFLDVPADR